MELNKETVKRIQGDIQVAVQSVAQKYGIKIANAGGSFGSLDATLRLKITATGDNGETTDQRNFKTYAKSYGLEESWLGKTFALHGGKEVKILGLLPKRVKYPILVRYTATGKEVLLTVESVQRGLGKPNGAYKVSPQTITLVTSEKDGTTVLLNKGDFTIPEWTTLERQLELSAVLGNRDRKLMGRLCVECKENKVVLVHQRQAGPEVVALGYRCVGCGATDSDVMD